MEPVVVVGAGIAGVAVARALTVAGVPVVLLDRGRRPGGRMAVRTTDGRPVDTGASYLTVSDPGFEQVVRDWERRGLARPWTDTFAAVGADGRSETQGSVRWAAPAGLRSLVEDLAEGLDLRRVTVERVDTADEVAGVAASAVVLAMPDPQARRLLGDCFAAERDALDDPFEPVLALIAHWRERVWEEVDGVFVNDDPVLSWVADDGLRRGDRAPVLVAHSTAGFATGHLDDPESATGAMVAALRRVVGATEEPAATHVHRWTFARPASGHDRPYQLGESRLGVCGDAWSDRPRVEAAWLSGTALGRELASRL
ncbi:NAD(P)/FAD-dependent oxidoreductase [Desertihabitans aurantiacus]|uniref:NAD(P)/FAD-dependent oxidoreductase n=1 Tax=Desertihabitans aurantiacus TaxID=2282477 RepID=UPI000DF83D29|nr:FAD-dependent oxidoreductase [Desertihabitans aurantiacus]